MKFKLALAAWLLATSTLYMISHHPESVRRAIPLPVVSSIVDTVNGWFTLPLRS